MTIETNNFNEEAHWGLGVMSNRPGGIGDYFQRVSQNLFHNVDHIYKFGRGNISTTEEVIWDEGGEYTFLTSADTLEILSDNINDTSSGSGARSVEIFGLDADYNALNEIVLLNGTTAVNTVNQYIRVYRARVKEVGNSNIVGGANQGDITIRSSTTPLNIQAKILANNGQTLMCIYTIPNGYAGLLWQASFSSSGNQNVVARLKTRDGSEADLAFTINAVRDVQTAFRQEYKIPVLLPEKTDVVFTAEGGAANIDVSASFLIQLIKSE